MRIAVYHNLPSGGAKRALYDYTRELVATGHEVDAFAPDTAAEDYLDLRPLVGRYHSFPLRIDPGPLLSRSLVAAELVRYARLRRSLMRHARDVAAQIDAGGYDLAFVHHCRYACSPYLLALLRTPSVYYCQEPRRGGNEYSVRHSDRRPTRAGRLAQRAHMALFGSLLDGRDIEAARAATMILANSVFSVESIKRAYGRYARLAYLGVDRAAFRPTGTPRAGRVLSVGALHPAKGHLLAVEAVGHVAQEARPALDIVADRGDEAHAEALRRRARELGVELVLHRRIDDGELVALYGRARAVLCAAELEPFGYTPLEAMACGTPVVAVREGGYKETVVDGRNGRLVERDARLLGEALAALLGDPPAWERLHRGALETAGEWTLERAAASLAARLAEVGAG
ncbi:MAG: glycosyltransferase family 4 protein [Solirubrobacteraceae bacterium]